jgi:hypothetical protein
MKTFYREPSRFKRFWNKHVVATVTFREVDHSVLRIRWWLPAIWLAHNTFLLVWYMVAAMAGRSVMFDDSAAWYWPLRTMWQLLN